MFHYLHEQILRGRILYCHLQLLHPTKCYHISQASPIKEQQGSRNPLETIKVSKETKKEQTISQPITFLLNAGKAIRVHFSHLPRTPLLHIITYHITSVENSPSNLFTSSSLFIWQIVYYLTFELDLVIGSFRQFLSV